jgi:hypothetical protein
MERARRPAEPQATAEIIDFDKALLAACPPRLRDELLTEAAMLADAFAPDRRADELEAMAQALSAGDRDAELGRMRARRLAAALRNLAE